MGGCLFFNRCWNSVSWLCGSTCLQWYLSNPVTSSKSMLWEVARLKCRTHAITRLLGQQWTALNNRAFTSAGAFSSILLQWGKPGKLRLQSMRTPKYSVLHLCICRTVCQHYSCSHIGTITVTVSVCQAIDILWEAHLCESLSLGAVDRPLGPADTQGSICSTECVILSQQACHSSNHSNTHSFLEYSEGLRGQSRRVYLLGFDLGLSPWFMDTEVYVYEHITFRVSGVSDSFHENKNMLIMKAFCGLSMT